MRPRELVLPLDPEAPEPLYRQLMAGLLEAIRQGRLRPGAPLPSTRDLAERCAVNRNTVLAAFRELTAEGWIEARPGSGSFVARHLPEDQVQAALPPDLGGEAGFDLRSHLDALSQGGPEGLDLREAWPDARLLPGDLLAEAYRTALNYRASEVLRPRPGGEPAFQRALLPWLGERRGLWTKAGHVLETRGERGALEVALRGLLRPGGRLALAFEALPGLQARMAGWGFHAERLPADGEGPRVEGLAEGGPGLVLVPPRLGPGPQPWSPERRQALLALARERRIPVVELEGPWELHGGPRPPLPLAAEDPHGVCLTVGGFEGILAPGLALGYLVGPPGPIQSLSRLAARLDLLGDPLLAAALAGIMADGSLAALLRRLRQTCRSRGEAAAAALAEALGPAFRVEVPPMGLGLWLHLPAHLDGRGWLRACRALGLRLPDPGAEGRALYLGFGAFEPATFAQAARLMARALQGP